MSNEEPRSDFVLEDPPNQPKFDWEVIAEKARANPGQWGKVFDNERISLVEAIRQGSIAALRPADGYEIATRNNKRVTGEDGKERRTCTLYLRYVKPKRVRKVK